LGIYIKHVAHFLDICRRFTTTQADTIIFGRCYEDYGECRMSNRGTCSWRSQRKPKVCMNVARRRMRNTWAHIIFLYLENYIEWRYDLRRFRRSVTRPYTAVNEEEKKISPQPWKQKTLLLQSLELALWRYQTDIMFFFHRFILNWLCFVNSRDFWLAPVLRCANASSK